LIEIREVLRACLSGLGQRPTARLGGLDRKIAARYIEAAQESRWPRDGAPAVARKVRRKL